MPIGWMTLRGCARLSYHSHRPMGGVPDPKYGPPGRETAGGREHSSHRVFHGKTNDQAGA